jgi:hypothetical protein
MSHHNTSTDASPPDGFPSPASGDSLEEQIATLTGWVRDLDERTLKEAEARRASDAKAEDQRGHMSGALLTLGGAVGLLREDVKGLASVVRDMGRGVESLRAHGAVAAESTGVLIGELAKVQRRLDGLARQDSIHDVEIAGVQGEVQKQGGALARVGKEITVLNGLRLTVVGVVTALAAHPGPLLDLVGKVLSKLFGLVQGAGYPEACRRRSAGRCTWPTCSRTSAPWATTARTQRSSTTRTASVTTRRQRRSSLS